MAPFNHFGAAIANTFPSTPPSSRARDVRKRNQLRDVPSVRSHHKRRSWRSRRDNQFDSDDSNSDSGNVIVTRRDNRRSRKSFTAGPKFDSALSSGTASVRARQEESGEESGEESTDDDDSERETKEVSDKKGGLDKEETVPEIGSADGSVPDPVKGGESPTAVTPDEPTPTPPAATEPAAIEPIENEPSAKPPAAAEPSAIDPIPSEPAAVVPTAAEPTPIEPTAVESTVIEPTAVEPTDVVLTSGEPTDAPTTVESTDVVPTAAEPSSIAVSVSEPATNTATASGQSKQPSLLPSSIPVAALPEASAAGQPTAISQTKGTDVVTAGATATPIPVAGGVQSAIIPASTNGGVSPTAVLQSAERVSLDNIRPTGAAGQKAQNKPDKDESSDDDDSDSDDDLEPDSDDDSPAGTRLVAFTTISGRVQSTPQAFLDPTVVGELPSGVTSVSQNGGKPTLPPPPSNRTPLSPEASHGLIAFGAVGSVLLFSFVMFFLIRMRKTDVFSCLKCCKSRRKTESIASQSLYRSSGAFGASAIDDHSKPQRGFSAFFNPVNLIRSDLSSNQGLDKSQSQGQNYSRNSLIQNAAPMAENPLTRTNDESLPPLPTMPPQYRQSVAKQNQRMSELSSLSSGFGDAVIDIPESGPTQIIIHKVGSGLPRPNQQTLGLDLGPRFSWANVPTPRTLGEHRNGDMVSPESTPRFRTVTSWVDQQSNRVMKNDSGGPAVIPGKERDGEVVPDLPVIPPEYTAGKHKRLPSEETDVVFKAHPGNEVEIKEGARIPSAQLTRKLRL